ncbi:MAG: hypothetical protein SVU88_01475, partial [Candidatus Nanohaloarchaea archaeon]|nr:hypothetical protein [Candidatus Nanohaloarchaea archaeon]
MPADDIDTERLYDDVQTYMEHVQQGLSLAWYAFHALQSKYKMEEAGDGTVYVGGRDTYPSADELYARYRPAREVHERREDAAYIGEDRGKDGRVSSEAPAVLPSAPRIQLRVPSLASYAEAYNELAEDAGIGDGLRAYIADAVGDEVEELVAVHEFLDTLPADTDHEEDILDRADGLAPGIADRVADVIAALSGRYEDVDDLPLRFRVLDDPPDALQRPAVAVER